MTALTAQKTKRKMPTQARSVATVEAILEATAHILVTDGLDKLSTNRVAKVAGASVGSLYQYFPNKVALIDALCERHLDDMMALLTRCLTEFAGASVSEAIRIFTKGMMEAHALEPKLHHAVMLASAQLGLATVEDLEARMKDGVLSWLQLHKDDIAPTDLDLAASILIRSVEAVTHSGLIEILPEPRVDVREQRLAALEEEIIRLILGYLGVSKSAS